MIRRALLCVAVALSPLLPSSVASGQSAVASEASAADPYRVTIPTVSLEDSLAQPAGAIVPAEFDAAAVFGVSGALRVAVLPSSAPVQPPLLAGLRNGDQRPRWIPIHGTIPKGLPGEPVSQGAVIAPDSPGMWRIELPDGSDPGAAAPLTFITTVPFTAKRDEHLNGYHIGIYPTERSIREDVYAPPEAFIEVTPQNQEVQLSEHFRLRQFLTKDQFDVWPKYLALNLRLVDKLELVMQELNAMGVRALGIHVMSGFRTPQYNGPGGDGRATLSRHMYGDAADIWVDGDHDGYIDDLNGDGRNDIRDAAVLLRAVERVEQKYPDLTGGAGLYEANDEHGPYVHVDVRGTRARW